MDTAVQTFYVVFGDGVSSAGSRERSPDYRRLRPCHDRPGGAINIQAHD